MKIVIGCGSNGVVTAHFTCFLSLSSLLFFFSFYWNQRAHVYSSEGMHTMSANTGHCGNVQGCNSFSLSLWVHVLVLSSFCICQSVSTRMCKRRRHIHLSVSNNLILSCLSQRSTWKVLATASAAHRHFWKTAAVWISSSSSFGTRTSQHMCIRYNRRPLSSLQSLTSRL